MIKAIIFLSLFFSFNLFSWQGEIILNDEEHKSWEPFVCNLGLKHTAGIGKICRDKLSEKPCLPDEHDCECSSSHYSNHSDRAQAFSVSESGVLEKQEIISSTTSWSSVYPTTSDPLLNKPLYRISFPLSSEVFGTSYFVDVCFPKTHIYNSDSFTYLSRISSSPMLIGPESYFNLAGLHYDVANIQGNCNLQGQNSGLWTGSLSEFTWTLPEEESCVLRYTFSETQSIERFWAKVDSRFSIKTRYPDSLCTLTIGFWENHLNHEAWNKVSPLGPDTPFFATGLSWSEVFKDRSSRRWKKKYMDLARQWMAVQLNYFNSVSLKPIIETFADSKHLLEQYSEAFASDDQTSFPRAQAVSFANELDRYNNGRLESPHCD